MVIPVNNDSSNDQLEKRRRIIHNLVRKPTQYDESTVNYSYIIKELASFEKDNIKGERTVGPLEKIEELRREIDECDNALVQIFERRMSLVLEILENKKKNALPILHTQREEEIITKALSNLNEENYNKEVEWLLREVLKISRSLQSKKLFPYNIVLIGFMGTGKSTVGRDLARKLEMGYKDTDAMIQEKMGMSISNIFEKHGEAFFRDIESKVVEEVSSSANTIIFCGGGVVLNKKNVENLRKNGRVVLLKAQPETILKRLHEDETRPVLKGYFSLEGLQELMNQRNQAYNDSADITIDTDNISIDEISTRIIGQLYEIDQTRG